MSTRRPRRQSSREVPPGPPVLSTLVAEVYGPDPKRQIAIAKQIKDVFLQTDGVVDVDWYVEDDQPKITFAVDKTKAALNGISTEAIAKTQRIALSGLPVGLVHFSKEKEPVEILLRMPVADRANITSLQQIGVLSPANRLIPLADLVQARDGFEDKTIYHKNLKRVTYVTGDVAGKLESPGYAILNMKDRIAQIKLPEGYALQQYYTAQPWLDDKYAMKWDGEWQITYEVFRDGQQGHGHRDPADPGVDPRCSNRQPREGSRDQGDPGHSPQVEVLIRCPRSTYDG